MNCTKCGKPLTPGNKEYCGACGTWCVPPGEVVTEISEDDLRTARERAKALSTFFIEESAGEPGLVLCARDVRGGWSSDSRKQESHAFMRLTPAQLDELTDFLARRRAELQEGAAELEQST